MTKEEREMVFTPLRAWAIGKHKPLKKIIDRIILDALLKAE